MCMPSNVYFVSFGNPTHEVHHGKVAMTAVVGNIAECHIDTQGVQMPPKGAWPWSLARRPTA